MAENTYKSNTFKKPEKEKKGKGSKSPSTVNWAFFKDPRFILTIGFVLLNIDVEEGTPATKIAPLMGLEARSLTRLLRTLEERGAIYRQVDANDKRCVRIFLTEEGKKGRARAKETVVQFNTVVHEQIPENKLDVFFDVIQNINKILDKNNIYEKAYT